MLSLIQDKLYLAKNASKTISSFSEQEKNDAIRLMSESLLENCENILVENKKDIDVAKTQGVSKSIIDRLMLDDNRIKDIADALLNITKLKDPVGTLLDSWTTGEGIHISKVSVALGVVAVIYENRPNVTADAAGLIIKSGNVAILRGSKGAINSNIAIIDALKKGLSKSKLPQDFVTFIDNTSREAAVELMQAKGYVDCLIPRGGPSLIQSIEENAKVPFIIDGSGNCHLYVDKICNQEKAIKVIVNAKAQRTSVCNSLETLLVHKDIAKEFIPKISKALSEASIVMHVSEQYSKFMIDDNFVLANELDFADEYLSEDIACDVVDNIEAAVEHIEKYSSKHTEVILSDDVDAIKYFTTNVTSAVVNVNASTRFSDGNMFGFGAEIGISTQKLHARGPMALKELTTYKYLVEGDYSIR